MVERRIEPDEVCYGATIAALSEAAGTQTRSTWGAGGQAAAKIVVAPRGTSWASAEGESRDDEDSASTLGAAVSGRNGQRITPTRAHEKAVALIEQMRRDGPRLVSCCSQIVGRRGSFFYGKIVVSFQLLEQ